MELVAEQGNFEIVKLITEKMITNKDDLTLAKKSLVACCALNGNISSLFEFAFKKENDEIFESLHEALCVFSKKAIDLYLQELRVRKESSHFFSGNLGSIRANTYLNLLKNKNIYETAMILLALFSSDDGETLKKQCINTFGFDTTKQAKSILLKLIENKWGSMNEINAERLNRIIAGIVYMANSEHVLPVERLTEKFNLLMASEVVEHKTNDGCIMM